MRFIFLLLSALVLEGCAHDQNDLVAKAIPAVEQAPFFVTLWHVILTIIIVFVILLVGFKVLKYYVKK